MTHLKTPMYFLERFAMTRPELMNKYYIVSVCGTKQTFPWNSLIKWNLISQYVKQGRVLKILVEKIQTNDDEPQLLCDAKSQFISSQPGSCHFHLKGDEKNDIYPAFKVKQSTILSDKRAWEDSEVKSSVKIRRLNTSQDCKTHDV